MCWNGSVRADPSPTCRWAQSSSERRGKSAKHSWTRALIVVDASAFVDLLLAFSNAASVENQLRTHPDDLHAPHLVDLEVLSALRRFGAHEQLSDFLDLPIERYAHTLLVPRVCELRDNFSTYDGVYVALAEGLEAPLLTSDKRFAKSVRKHTDVEVLLAA